MGNLFHLGFKCDRISVALYFFLLWMCQTVQADGTVGGLKKQEPSVNGVASINDGRIIETDQLNMSNYQKMKITAWQEINLGDCWNISNKEVTFKNAGLFYSPVFGYSIANKKTFQEHKFPEGKYWEDSTELERTCICTRKIATISPDLIFSNMVRRVVYNRFTGPSYRHVWNWNNNGYQRNPTNNRLITTMTVYKAMAIKLFLTYATVEADCTSKMETNYLGVGQYATIRAKAYLKVKEGPYDIDWANSSFKSIWIHESNRFLFLYVSCRFKGRGLAFEPLQGDFVIQEVDTLWEPLERNFSDQYFYRLFHHFDGWGTMRLTPEIALSPSQNIWPVIFDPRKYNPQMRMNFTDDWDERIRWVRPTTNKREMYDGPVQLETNYLPDMVRLPIYRTHPAMSNEDVNCKKRVARNNECKHPVGDINAKLRFWEEVNYDPASNKSRFPALPLVIHGKGHPEWSETDSSRGSMYETSLNNNRHKRQIFGIAALIFSSINYSRSKAMQTELNDRISELTSQLNVRFSRDEQELKKIANKLNELSRANYIQSERLNVVIIDMIKEEQLRQSEVNYLAGEISELQQVTLSELDAFLHQVRDIRAMSLAEMTIDQLIMGVLKNATAKLLFDTSKVYLARISRGVLHLKEYAQLIAKEKAQVNETDKQNVQHVEQAREALAELVKKGELARELWVNGTNSTRIFINTTEWKYKNISIDPINVTIGDDLFQGLGVVSQILANGSQTIGSVLQKGISTVGSFFGNILGSGMSALAAPLLKILTPIIVFVTGFIILCCLIQHHPKCTKAKAKLPSYFQVGNPLGEQMVRRRIKKHKLKNIVKTGIEDTALAAI